MFIDSRTRKSAGKPISISTADYCKNEILVFGTDHIFSIILFLFHFRTFSKFPSPRTAFPDKTTGFGCYFRFTVVARKYNVPLWAIHLAAKYLAVSILYCKPCRIAPKFDVWQLLLSSSDSMDEQYESTRAYSTTETAKFQLQVFFSSEIDGSVIRLNTEPIGGWSFWSCTLWRLSNSWEVCMHVFPNYGRITHMFLIWLYIV